MHFRPQLNGRQRHRNAHVVEKHLVGENDPPVGNDLDIGGAEIRNRAATLSANDPFVSTLAKVELEETLADLKKSNDPKQNEVAKEWEQLRPYVNTDIKPVEGATLEGTHQTLIVTAMVPATMAVLYLLLIVYFQMKGGYKPLEVSKAAEERSAEAPWEG